jgi:hypothetical protein
VDVRDLPADGGERCLPVIHFYGRPFDGASVPLAASVGFTQGDAVAWYPQTDAHNPAEVRSKLLWQDLQLRVEATAPALQTQVEWTADLRGIDEALWVEHNGESERFLFYEGSTTESADIEIRRVPTWADETPALRIVNTGTTPMHSVFVTQRQPWGEVSLFTIPELAAGETRDVLGKDASGLDLRSELRQTLVMSQQGPLSQRLFGDGCVAMRDPGVGVSWPDDHRLFDSEADALLDAWQDRFFAADGLTVVYREDASRLKQAMPLSLYTDMYHSIVLNRLGLVLVEDAVIQMAR